MLVSGISSNTNLYRTTNPQMKSRQIRDNFQQLAQALQAGNLNGALQAFAALQQLMPDLSAGNQIQTGQQDGSQGLFRTDFNALGQALKSGDLPGAKAAFAKLQQDMQSVQGHHYYHHHNAFADAQGTSPATSSSSAGTDNAGSSINITT